MDDLIYLYALSKIPAIGHATVRELLKRFGSYPEIFGAPAVQLLKIKRITPAIAAEIMKFSLHLDELRQELEEIQDKQIQLIPVGDSRYPNLLKLIPDSPILLFMLGKVIPEDEISVAIIGSRSASEIGKEIAAKLATKLAQQGITIVSGLAIGIDTAGHQGALSGNGRTIACLGSGFYNIYPPENTELAERISQSGALVSEYAPNTAVDSWRLLARDRLIAALSKAVIVIESEEDGGAIYTARKSVKYGRQVYYLNWGKFQDLPQEAKPNFVSMYLKENGLPLNNIAVNVISQLVSTAQEKIKLTDQKNLWEVDK